MDIQEARKLAKENFLKHLGPSHLWMCSLFVGKEFIDRPTLMRKIKSLKFGDHKAHMLIQQLIGKGVLNSEKAKKPLKHCGKPPLLYRINREEFKKFTGIDFDKFGWGEKVRPVENDEQDNAEIFVANTYQEEHLLKVAVEKDLNPKKFSKEVKRILSLFKQQEN